MSVARAKPNRNQIPLRLCLSALILREHCSRKTKPEPNSTETLLSFSLGTEFRRGEGSRRRWAEFRWDDGMSTRVGSRRLWWQTKLPRVWFANYDCQSYDFLCIKRRFDQGRHNLFLNLRRACEEYVGRLKRFMIYDSQSCDFLFVESRQESFIRSKRSSSCESWDGLKILK